MELFLKHKIMIMRSLGAMMLIVGIVIHFWVTPQKGLSANDKAAARVARMEASAKGQSSSSSKSQQNNDVKFLKALKDTQAKQMQYLTIIVIILGVGSLVYSFISKQEEDEETL